MDAETPVPRCLELDVPTDGRVIVASDLFLTGEPTPASACAAEALTNAISEIRGPGALVIAGNLFQLQGNASPGVGITPAAAELQNALETHTQLSAGLERFLESPDHRVILLPGTRDRAICYDPATMTHLNECGFEIALAVHLNVATTQGERQVRVEPGWHYDPLNDYADATDPRDTPLGHHAIAELFPSLKASKTGWLEGIDRLADQAGMPRFVASRLIYRRVLSFGWLLLAPIAVAVIARLPELWLYGVPDRLRHIMDPVRDITISLLLELIVIAVLLAVVNHRLWLGPGSALLGPGGDRANDGARDAARVLVAEGYAGLITGHTLRAELSSVGAGFFANTGACAELVDERAALFGMPPVFVRDEQISYVEIEGGPEVKAQLHLAKKQKPAGSLLERLTLGPRRAPIELSVVASFPGTTSWPPVSDPTRHRRLIRRAAAAVVLLSGVLDLVTALAPVTVRGHLHPYFGYVPLAASKLAGALDAFAGIALLMLALGLRRGQRLAWYISIGVIAATTILHVLREGQIFAALAALAVVLWLLWARDSFRGRFDPPSVRAGAWALVGGVVGVTAFSTFALWFGVAVYRHDHHHTHVQSLSFLSAFTASAEGLIGVDRVTLPDTVGDFLDPALIAVGIGIALVALVLIFRPVVDRRLHRQPSEVAPSAAPQALVHAGSTSRMRLSSNGDSNADEFSRARDVVTRRGAGTLDYFALRFDKQHYFDRDSVVAYAIRSGVCLVSPDPIGPIEEREHVWAGFRKFADEHGLAVAVLAAGQDWLPIYENSGMRDLYIGDEGVVDVRTLSLEGGAKKGLRQAVNRIAKYGYTITYHDPANMEADLADQVRSVMTMSRRGGVERGFSMTLGRIFEPADEGLLLAVAHDPTGKAVAFCQYVPAPGIEGFSLDLMRRDHGDHPNGLLDFILIRTMEYLKADGYARLGLNFAMMRAVLAGEAGDSLPVKVERWVLKHMSDSMQIESLWKFNAKFDPEWLPRYVVWDSAEQSLAAALAIAKAESFWELPVIGRFLVPAEA